MDPESGGLSRRRQIRLDAALDRAVVAEAKRLHLRPSQVIRLALTSTFCLNYGMNITAEDGKSTLILEH